MDLAAINEIFQAARPWIGGLLCLLGGALALVGTGGGLRFPDFYTRLHAASVTDTSAATALLLGMAFLPGVSGLILIKLAAIWLFIFITGPTSSHAVANAAHTAGLEPVIGRGSQPSSTETQG